MIVRTFGRLFDHLFESCFVTDRPRVRGDATGDTRRVEHVRHFHGEANRILRIIVATAL